MLELDFRIRDVEVERFAVAPTLLFGLLILPGVPIRNITLRCQIRIEPTRRGYEAADQERLSECSGKSSAGVRRCEASCGTMSTCQCQLSIANAI